MKGVLDKFSYYLAIALGRKIIRNRERGVVEKRNVTLILMRLSKLCMWFTPPALRYLLCRDNKTHSHIRIGQTKYNYNHLVNCSTK